MPTYVFKLEPHPLANLKSYAGAMLMRFNHPENWRCLTEEERFALCIGGRRSPRFNTPGTACYSLSKAQARDLCALIDGGFGPFPLGFECRHSNDAERSFWHPDYGEQWLTRAEAIESLAIPARCSRTIEMELAPPIAEPAHERAMQAEQDRDALRADLDRERAALAAVTERNARLLQGMADLAERVERAEAAIAA